MQNLIMVDNMILRTLLEELRELKTVFENNTNNEELLPVSRAAILANVDNQTIRARVRDGKLKFSKELGPIRIFKSDLMKESKYENE